MCLSTHAEACALKKKCSCQPVRNAALWPPSCPVSPSPDAADWHGPWAAPTVYTPVRVRGHSIAQRSLCGKEIFPDGTWMS